MFHNCRLDTHNHMCGTFDVVTWRERISIYHIYDIVLFIYFFLMIKKCAIQTAPFIDTAILDGLMCDGVQYESYYSFV